MSDLQATTQMIEAPVKEPTRETWGGWTGEESRLQFC